MAQNDIDAGEVLVERRIVAAPHNRTRLVAWILVIGFILTCAYVFRRSVGTWQKPPPATVEVNAPGPATNSSIADPSTESGEASSRLTVHVLADC